MDDLNTIRQIREGKPLTDFDPESVTPIMALAALNTRDAWKEIPERIRNRRFAKMAVHQNFRNLAQINPEYVMHCTKIYAQWASKIERKELEEYKQILNSQDDNFILGCIRQDRQIKKYARSVSSVSSPNPASNNSPVIEAGPTKNTLKKEHFFVDQTELDAYDFTGAELGDNNELNPEAFLARPVEEQTLEDLELLLELPDNFPPDFIDRLQLPYKNAAFYHAQGDAQKEALWNAKKLPWLNKDVCMHIAQMHPEASVKTPGYLTKEGITHFWQWSKENQITDNARTDYYLSFPPQMLSKEMVNDLVVDWRVIRHTPEFFLEMTEDGRQVYNETARKYLNKHPNDVFRLPEQFQTITKIIADGTQLNLGNIVRIKNPQLKELIACAMGLELPQTTSDN